MVRVSASEYIGRLAKPRLIFHTFKDFQLVFDIYLLHVAINSIGSRLFARVFEREEREKENENDDTTGERLPATMQIFISVTMD